MLKEILHSKAVPGLVIERWGQGDPVFLLHGLGASRRQWVFQLPILAQHRTVYAWDARGFGESVGAGAVTTLADFAQDLHKVFDELKIPAAHVLGSSLGGRVAFDFAECFPGRVHSLVLYDTFPGSHLWFIPHRLIKAAIDFRNRGLRAGRQTMADLAKRVARLLTAKTTGAAVRQLVRDGLARCDVQVYLKTVDALFADARVVNLAKIKVPTLILNGDQDVITPPFLARYMAARIPRAQLRLLKDCGHVGNLEKPEVFNQLVQEFWANLDSGR